MASSYIVYGDAAQLQSALLNLGINARDAMPDGGLLQISTHDKHLDADACGALPFDIHAGRYLEIDVRDSGSGISAQALPRIFEPFFTTKDVGKGTGMGLAAVYGAVVEHRGAVMVQSQLDSGTQFQVYLPVLDSASIAPDPARAAPSGTGLVLLVDDEPLVLTSASHLLRSIGYEVVTARDGHEAFEQFQVHQAQLVAVVCDAMMPRESGPQVLRRIGEAAPWLPCVLCSGFNRDSQLMPAESRWFLLPKPYRRADLAQTLSAAIAARASVDTGVGP
jgi:CheY-like chemotaxis protein